MKKHQMILILAVLVWILVVPAFVRAEVPDCSSMSDDELILCYRDLIMEILERDSQLALRGKQVEEEKNVLSDFFSARCDYVLNTSGNTVHLPTCKELVRISVKNLVMFNGTLEEIAEFPDHYKECNKCKPDPKGILREK